MSTQWAAQARQDRIGGPVESPGMEGAGMREPAVPAAVRQLHHEADQFRECIDELEKKLVGVMRKADVANKPQNGLVPPHQTCDIATGIVEAREKFSSLRERLNDMISSLEV